VIFETPRIKVREFQPSDAEQAFAFYGDSNLFTYVSQGNAWATEADKSRVIDSHTRYYSTHPGFGFWAIEEKVAGIPIGHIVVKPLEESSEVELGWMIAASWQKRGYATEAAHGAVDYAFKNLKLKEIFAICEPANLASIRVMEKCGFVSIGQAVHYGHNVLKFCLRLENHLGRNWQ
jgi:[ribosomal protein S5]-alanine N-acetyltransferase